MCHIENIGSIVNVHIIAFEIQLWLYMIVYKIVKQMDEKNKWHLFNDTNFSPRLNLMDQNEQKLDVAMLSLNPIPSFSWTLCCDGNIFN